MVRERRRVVPARILLGIARSFAPSPVGADGKSRRVVESGASGRLKLGARAGSRLHKHKAN